jgi:hypothetical protein
MTLTQAFARLAVFVAVSVIPVCAVGADEDYITDENVLIKTPGGAQISAFVVRPRDESSSMSIAGRLRKSTMERARTSATRSVADAKEPLHVEWFNDSHVDIPISQ